jgi:hypothetical protein
VISMEELTKSELYTFELLVDEDERTLIELLNRKVKAQNIRKGVAA